ncbi:hypothetical protein NLG97_g7066 [Lecanicillium saksenae]|uniref:Uncharacterized protein n=1 Tax=Lecanicillium saksenae TaxID=468837 RepID=A0ACC1QPG6_9HYPO|nr:hypothetical protein NLG97_g7066 [Lecanicillium saksenae]
MQSGKAGGKKNPDGGTAVSSTNPTAHSTAQSIAGSLLAGTAKGVDVAALATSFGDGHITRQASLRAPNVTGFVGDLPTLVCQKSFNHGFYQRRLSPASQPSRHVNVFHRVLVVHVAPVVHRGQL